MTASALETTPSPKPAWTHAKELVKVGLTEFDDYIRAGHVTAARRAPRARCLAPDPEMEQARQELAQYARELTDGGRAVIRLYSEVMDGLKNDEGFKPHHRIAAGRELLRRGFDYYCAHAAPTVVRESGNPERKSPTFPEDGNPESVRPETDSILIPKYPELKIDEEPVDLVAIAKEIAENLDPSELEEEPPTTYKPSYAMWDIINKQPRPVITEEHARIGSARFNARIEQKIACRESGVKIPTRKDPTSTTTADPDPAICRLMPILIQ